MRWLTRGFVVLALTGGVVACTIEQRTDRDAAAAQSTRRQIIQPEGVAGLPYFSLAVRSGGLIFLTGQVGAVRGVDPPELVDGGIEAETRQAMENIVAVLEAAGATPRDVLKCTVFLTDIDDYDEMNAVYREYFPSDPPARSAMAVSALALGALVEIECIAAAPGAS